MLVHEPCRLLLHVELAPFSTLFEFKTPARFEQVWDLVWEQVWVRAGVPTFWERSTDDQVLTAARFEQVWDLVWEQVWGRAGVPTFWGRSTDDEGTQGAT